MERWWIRFDGRLQFELDALTRMGAGAIVNATALARGVIQLDVEYLGIPLTAVFPDSYPFFRPDVLAPTLELRHHQNPFSKSLCLLGRASANWNATDTLAWLLEEQLPRVMSAGGDQQPSSGVEEEQAEPISEFYQYEGDSFVYVDGSWPRFPEGTTLLLGLADRLPPFRAAVLGGLGRHGDELFRAEDSFDEAFPRDIFAPFIRIEEAIHAADGAAFRARLGQLADLSATEWHEILPERHQLQVIAVGFPEETGYREMGEGLAFVVSFKTPPGRALRREGTFLARVGRVGRADLEQRLPEAKLLKDTIVAVVGLGCLGATSALEFARAGVGELRLIDHDVVEGGTIVRWPLGIPAVGREKVAALSEFIRQHYPHTKVTVRAHQIGRSGDGPVFDELLTDADLILDAAVEEAVSHLLSDHCSRQQIVHVKVSATNGGYGGQIARFDGHGCWVCLQHAIQNGLVGTPPGLIDTETVQPAGCASPTYLGGAFDLGEVSLAGVRLAISTLCKKRDAAYPDFQWDVAVLSLRNSAGQRIAPEWQTYPMTRAAACTVCGKSEEPAG